MLTKVSKFLSFVLRHQPEAIGIKLDSEGWVEIESLLWAANNMKGGMPFDRATLDQVVETNEKKRFQISEDGKRIRAVQGHSTNDVDRGFEEKVPPEFLYHGTAQKTLDTILDDGVISTMTRQYVHLSADYDTARQVGSRHGKPIVLQVCAGAMQRAGAKFYQAENGVWLSQTVPLVYIEVMLRKPDAEQEDQGADQAQQATPDSMSHEGRA